MALALFEAAQAFAACPGETAQAREFSLQRDQPRTVAVAGSGSRILVEEIGVDVQYRWRTDDADTAVDVPPNRLGFAVLDRVHDTLTLRVKKGQGGGRVRITSCLDAPDAAFLAALAQWQSRYLGGSAADARTGQPLLAALAPLAVTRAHRAWLGNANANALLTAGRASEAVAAFGEARGAWRAAERPDRAAIALMAAGEDATRSGRFDEAQAQLEQARDELTQARIGYYALRSEAALCILLLRRAQYRDAIACEEPVARRMERSGEFAETVSRHVSAANLWLRFDGYTQAHAHLRTAQAHLNDATDISRARYEAAFGNYSLATGDLPAAAQAYARASARLGAKGLLTEQANLDEKLAWLAELAGAHTERRRLLDRAAARLTPQDAPIRLAELWTDLAEIDLDLGDPAAAMVRLASARTLCGERERAICADGIGIVEAQALLDLGRVAPARALLATLPSEPSPQRGHTVSLLAARALIADGQPEAAARQLAALDARKLDPNQRALRTRLDAATKVARGDADSAVRALADELEAQARQAATWPSAALRISARDRLATLQAAVFTRLTNGPGDAIDAATFARLVDTIDAASVRTLFRTPATGKLPAALRQTLSAGVIAAQAPDRRELFLALAQTDAPTATAVRARDPRALPTLTPGHRVLLPLEGETTFALVAWSGGAARVCLRLPRVQYRALAERYDRALDGDDRSLDDLAASAREWHAAIRRCLPDAPPERRWSIVSVPGTHPLPWAWIAAATDAEEPTVETVFEFPTSTNSLPAQLTSVTLLDLDMPNAAALPSASHERKALQATFARRRLPYRTIAGSDADVVLAAMHDASALHVIGHANPAVYGQLYQGLWFESDGKPALLTWPEIAAAGSKAQIVVLSACGTDAGKQAAFGATSRLAEAYIAAGARRVVAASNALSDAAAPVWTGVFYESLWKNADASAAARDARAALRASPHFRHPKFWAGIELYVGAPDTRRGLAPSIAKQ